VAKYLLHSSQKWRLLEEFNPLFPLLRFDLPASDLSEEIDP